MLRRLAPLAAAVAALAALAAPAAATAQTTAAPPSCPTFSVLDDDGVGALSLPKGTYAIVVATPSTLSCAAAADLFRQFLEDFDGRLSGGWTVDASTATFSRGRGAGRQAFSVSRTTAALPLVPVVQPAGGGTCPGTFQVLHDDAIGALRVPAGAYRIDLVAAGRLTCAQAAARLAAFLRDYDGRLPSPWIVDPETATFLRGGVEVGFRIEPVAGTAPAGPVTPVPGDGRACPGSFQVLHDDRAGRLPLPAGPYLLVPLTGSSLSCAEASTWLRRFLAAPGDRLPGPWVVSASTGTFRHGRGSRVGFRVKPLPAPR